MRPIARWEAILVEQGFYADPNPTTLFTLARQTDMTDVLLAELIHTVKHRTHFIAPFDGETGEGKSYAAMRLLTKDRFLKHEINGDLTETVITWSPLQTMAKSWKGAFKPNDNILQDEHRKKSVGVGSGTADAGLASLEQTSFRFDGNSILFCSPEKHKHRQHFALEAMGWETELVVDGRLLRNVNVLMLRGPKFDMPMGMVYLDEDDWPLDPYILTLHQKQEREYKIYVRKFGGIPSEVDPEIMDFCQSKLIDYLETHHRQEMFNMKTLELEQIYLSKLHLPALVFFKQVIAAVQANLLRKKREYEAQEFIEHQKEHEDHILHQKALVDVIAPRMVKHFRRFTTDEKMTNPSVRSCKHYLRRATNLDKEFFQECIDATLYLWTQMKAGYMAIEEAREIVTAPPPMKAGDFIANPLDPFWFEFVLKKKPKVPKKKYFDAYRKYIDGKRGWTSHRKVGKSMKPPVAKGTVTQMFGKIEGHMKREMGYEFERVLARFYDESPSVVSIEPKLEDFKPAKKGDVDLVAQLTSGQIRIISIKSHNENENIGVKKTSPEVKMLRELKSQDKDVHMVIEGLFEGRFFSIDYDLSHEEGSVRVKDEHFSEWPPDLEKLLDSSFLPGEDRLEYSPPTGEGDVEGSEEGRMGAEEVSEEPCVDGADEQEELVKDPAAWVARARGIGMSEQRIRLMAIGAGVDLEQVESLLSSPPGDAGSDGHHDTHQERMTLGGEESEVVE